MITIQEYLLSKNKPKLNIIKATDDTIKQIVKDELDKLGLDADLNHIDVSGVTHMDSLFSCYDDDFLGPKYKDLNPDISKWNVSNAKNMEGMFYKCEKFNKDLSQWDVSSVEDMNGMFCRCEKFNQNLSQWDVSSVTDMRCMFYCCENFSQDLSKWDVSKVEYTIGIFDSCPIKEEFKPKFKE